MLPYLQQILLWLVYGALHSILASNGVKQFFQRILGSGFHYYRLIYNALAFVLLVGLWLHQRTLPLGRLWEFDWLMDTFAMSLKFLGVIIIFLALKGYDLGEFVGLKTPQQSAQAEFRMGGLLRYMRHPLYTGTILFVLGLFLEKASISYLIMAVCATIYILIGIVFEERKLIRQFGKQYLDYRRRIPMLIPKFF